MIIFIELNNESEDIKTSIDIPQYLIMDLGSQHMKIGFSGDGYPRFIIPSVVGYENFPPKRSDIPLTAYDALYAKNIHLTYPFQEKTVTEGSKGSEGIEWNWTSAKELISSAIRQLKINPEEYFVFYILPMHGNPLNTKRLISLLKDKFRFREVFTFNQSILTMQQMNKTSGLLIELGHSISSIVAYYKGFEIKSSLRFFSITGRIIAEEFAKIIKNQIKDDVTTYELVRVIDKHFYIVNDYEQEQEDYDRKYIKDVDELLPYSNKRITLGDERFRLPETLFNPSLIDKDIEGFVNILKEVIEEIPIDTRSEILSNVILSGGLSKLRGLDNRIKYELKKLFPNLDINILAHIRREVTAWIAADSLCRKGIPDNENVVQSQDIDFKIPDMHIEQLYNETINCNNANLYLATLILGIQTIEAIIKSLSNKDVPLLSIFSALRDEKIIDEEFYRWASNFSFIRNPSSKHMIQNATKSSASDIVEFLKNFLEILYKPVEKKKY